MSSSLGCRTSIFAQRDTGTGCVSSKSAMKYRAASRGAAFFIVGAQIFVVGVLFFYSPAEQLSFGFLLPVAFLFNAVMLWNWASDPGFVSVLAEPSYEEKELLRWCSVCRLWQPLRAKHCRSCERCVRKYDHHCFWIGGCVGEANHLRFYVLLTVTPLYLLCLLFNFFNCFSIRDYATADSAIIYNFLPFVLFVVDGFMTFLTVALWVFHGALLSRNCTTWEFSSHHRITYLHSRRDNPFDKGFFSNISFLFQRQPIDWFLVLQQDNSDVV